VKTFLIVIVILGVIYAGIGLVIANTGSESWKSWVGQNYSVLGWPKLLVDMRSGSESYQAYCQGGSRPSHQPSSSGGVRSSASAMMQDPNLPSEARGRVASIQQQVDNGQVSTAEAERMLQGIGDAYLGKGKTERIMGIARDAGTDRMSEKEAAGKIVDEVPTGLPGPVDKWTKKVAKGVSGVDGL